MVELQNQLRDLGANVKILNSNLVTLDKSLHRKIHRNTYKDWVYNKLSGAYTLDEINRRLIEMNKTLTSIKAEADLNAAFPKKR